MASMDAINRAASAPQGAPTPPPPGPESQPQGQSGGGIDTLVENLSAVGEFLKAQGDNPASQEAMTHLQALIQSLMALGGGGGAGGNIEGSQGGPNGGNEPKIM